VLLEGPGRPKSDWRRWGYKRKRRDKTKRLERGKRASCIEKEGPESKKKRGHGSRMPNIGRKKTSKRSLDKGSGGGKRFRKGAQGAMFTSPPKGAWKWKKKNGTIEKRKRQKLNREGKEENKKLALKSQGTSA